MKASVIIPTLNRPGLLNRCLESLTRQTLPANNFEILVVDNASDDNTKEVVKSFSGLLDVKYYKEPEKGLHAGRHLGLRLAKSETLIYGDDDIEATPTWIETIVDVFKDPSVVLVGGNNYPKFECSPPAWLDILWKKRVYRGQALSYLSIIDFGNGQFDIDPLYIWGCNFSARKNIILEYGGFHPDGFPSDRLLYRGDGENYISNRIKSDGKRAVFHSGASIYHWVPKERMTKEYFHHRAFMSGITTSYVEIRASGQVKITHSYLRVFVDLFKRVLKFFIKRIFMRINKDELIIEKIYMELSRAHLKGYLYHQKYSHQNREIFSWVIKGSYL